jgi:hypothetical protein
MTIAFATLNLMTYVFWWNKPLNIQYPLRIFLKRPMAERRRERSSKPRDCRWLLLWVVRVALGEEDVDVDLTAQTGVPLFYAGDVEVEKRRLATVTGGVIAMIFGAIHCIAWSFSFPTRTEQILWRVCSITITSVPVICLTLLVVLLFFDVDYSGRSHVDPVWAVVYYIGVPTPLLAYIIARVVLLTQAFMTLRLLPADAYQTVHWTTFIPHIM